MINIENTTSIPIDFRPPPPLSQINLYFSIIIMPLGIILNISTIIIFSRSQSRNSSWSNMRILSIGLSIFNILAMVNSLLFQQYLPAVHVVFSYYSQDSCKLVKVFSSTILQCSSWVQVIITFDRLRSVAFSARFMFMNRPINLVIILVSMFFTVFIANITLFWFWLTPVNGKTPSLELVSPHMVIANNTVIIYKNSFIYHSKP